MLLAQLCLPGCGGSSTSPTPSETVLLNTAVSVAPGPTCTTGGVSTDFAGTAGRAVTITANGAATLAPRFTLYAPDFTTQLGGSAPAGAGAASLTFTLIQTGTHHVSLCDLNGAGGTLTVKVTQK